jgi:D-3-phosphoglycerate dehydrogenase
MPHVVIAGAIDQSGLDLIEAAKGVTYDYIEAISEESYAPFIHKADGLVIRTQPLSERTIANASKLKIVSRHGVGYDAVAVEALTKRDISLAIVGDVNSRSVAEHTMMMILAAAKRLPVARDAVLCGNWNWRNLFEAGELDGKELLIIGFGRIGRHLAKMAQVFGLKVVVFDPYLHEAPPGVSFAARLSDAMATADIVSVHAPMGEKPLIGADELKAAKRGVILVNTSRGGIIDEAAMVASLRNGQVGAAALDVFEEEPPSADNPLFQMNQVIVTPHIAGLTKECARRMAVVSVKNVLDFFNGKLDPALVVNGVLADAG